MDADEKDHLNPDAWVDAAYVAFEKGGVGAVRVDRLAKELGITRGSFYWHFENRNALLRAVVEKWAALDTDATIAANDAEGGTPPERLMRLLKTCASDDGALEIGMRAWAREDDAAMQRLLQIDDRRISYLAQLCSESGISETDARLRARVGYLAWLGFYTGTVTTPVEQRLADVECLWSMLLAPPAS